MPHLGLVCITVSKDIRYRTVTRTRLHAQSPEGQSKTLEDIYRDNLQTLDGALRYCEQAGISLYRLPSSIFPFADVSVDKAHVIKTDIAADSGVIHVIDSVIMPK